MNSANMLSAMINGMQSIGTRTHFICYFFSNPLPTIISMLLNITAMSHPHYKTELLLERNDLTFTSDTRKHYNERVTTLEIEKL